MKSDGDLPPTTYTAAGIRIDDATGKPIIRVMKALRPQVSESASMEKAFEIGRAAHEQIERKFNNGTKKEYTQRFDRGDYIIECHADLFNPKDGGLVMEIKSWRYFVEEHQSCIWQLSAYKALLGAANAWFILYEGEFVKKADGKEEFRVKSKSQAFVPLMSSQDILTLLDAKAHELIAKYCAEGKL